MSHSFEIQRAGWATYLDRLSKRSRTRSVRVEVVDRELGDQEMAAMLPLVGLECETKGSAAGDVTISVSVDGDRGVFDHRIMHPTRVFVEESDQGMVEALDIEESGGGKTIVHFGPKGGEGPAAGTSGQA